MTKKLFTAKKIVAIFASLMLCCTPLSGFASVLGSSRINGYTTQIGEGTYYTHNVFYSDQSGVGKQSENYIVYTPNSTVIPSITNGTTLFGASTLSSETSRLEGLNNDILGGSNADFFSTQTGVPMSNAIVDGKILTKDASGQDGIGILPDGTAFISYFYLNSVLTKEDGSEVNIYNINKYRQPYAVYMMTEEFSSETQNTTEGIDVILGSIDGEMRLGTKMTAVVESVNHTTGSAKIPAGKIVITVDAKAPSEFLEPISSLKVGEKVTISFSATGDSRWSSVKVGMGSVGGRLLINGEVNPNLSAGAAPRTAIGIKADNSIVLYTIDGRQSGHSYGVQLKTLAKRMQELGCVEALNLDGGGSTAMVIQQPGNASATLVNKPSDGKERKVSTYFYFVNTAKKTGVPEKLHLYPQDSYVLLGASLNLNVKATDSGFYPVQPPTDIQFLVDEGVSSTISRDGTFVAKDNGIVTVYAKSGDVSGKLNITVLETPTDIVVTDNSNGSTVTSLSLSSGDELDLNAAAYGGYNKLTATDENFTWSADQSIGTISSTGKFKAAENYGAKGNIYVSAGKKTVTIPVTLAKPEATDPKAYPVIEFNIDGENLKVKISCAYSSIICKKDDIILKVDGKATEFEYNQENGVLTAILPVNAQKITVFAGNEFGYTSFKTMTLSKGEAASAPFADTSGHWAEEILDYMYFQKIISGDPADGTLRFNPQKPMTRSEFAVMITNYLGLNPQNYTLVNLPYSDIDAIPSWALDSFKALYREGILKGRYITDEISCADPLATITRCEAATIVARTLPSGFLKKAFSAQDIDDVPSWAAEGVSTLISLGAMKGYEDGSLKPLNTLTKAEAAKILYSIM